MKQILSNGIFAAAALFAVTALNASQPVTIALSTVGNPGNAADTVTASDGSGLYFGNVGYTFNIGTYDVTQSQYTAFLNAVAQTDTYGVYNASMATAGNGLGVNNGFGITRGGSPGSYSYTVNASFANLPVAFVTWFDAARFCNWMQNGEPTTGVENATTTETGAYTLNGATSGIYTKNLLAQWYIPSENEWYKAAYYDPTLNGGLGGYWTYATRSNSAPGTVVGSNSNQANYEYYNGSSYLFSVTQSPDPSSYSSSQNYWTPVGAFTNSASYYGTYDQAGDVLNWNDAVIGGAYRGLRGGDWRGDSSFLAASSRLELRPEQVDYSTGFRVANAPEPNSVMLIGLGTIVMASLRRKPSAL